MVKKLFLTCAIYLLSSSLLLAIKPPPQLPESFFKDLKAGLSDGKKDSEIPAEQNPAQPPQQPSEIFFKNLRAEILKNRPKNPPAQTPQQHQPPQVQSTPSQPPFLQNKPQPRLPSQTPPQPPQAQLQPPTRMQKEEMPPKPRLQQHTSNTSQKPHDPCSEIPLYLGQILDEIFRENSDIISRLPSCFALDRKLILKAVVINPLQFQYADDSLLEDPTFVNRLLKISPEVLQFASPEIRSSATFMENATYLSRDALKYASWKLLDKKPFMKRMITIDSRNYKFASNRLKTISEFAKIAFKDNGLLLEFAPKKIKNNKSLVKIAILSNSSAIDFASNKLKKNKELKKLAKKRTSVLSTDNLEKFLRKNYIVRSEQLHLDDIVGNQAKFYKEHQLISRNYITKWQDYINYSYRKGRNLARDTKLISAASRNYDIPWQDDFKEYEAVKNKITKFLKNHRVPNNVIEKLSTTYLWKVKGDPLTLAFNLYLLRESADEDLGPDFADVTSLTAIIQKRNKRWEMTIVEVILNSEIKVDITYPGGHKKYILWDLYETDETDDNPKIIFRVENGLNEHFEVFEEQVGGKYQSIHRSKSL